MQRGVLGGCWTGAGVALGNNMCHNGHAAFPRLGLQWRNDGWAVEDRHCRNFDIVWLRLQYLLTTHIGAPPVPVPAD
eukprot:scaffold73172_cov59-Attheya_sp.AAC.2